MNKQVEYDRSIISFDSETKECSKYLQVIPERQPNVPVKHWNWFILKSKKILTND